MFIKFYDFYLTHFYFAPILAWIEALKQTKVNLLLENLTIKTRQPYKTR